MAGSPFKALDTTTLALVFGGGFVIWYLASNKLYPFTNFDINEIFQGLKPKPQIDESENDPTIDANGKKALVLEDKFDQNKQSIINSLNRYDYPNDLGDIIEGGDPRLPDATINQNLNDAKNLFGYGFNSFVYDSQGNIIPIPLPSYYQNQSSIINACKNTCETLYAGNTSSIDACKRGCESNTFSSNAVKVQNKIYKPKYNLTDKFTVFGYNYDQRKNIIKIKKFNHNIYDLIGVPNTRTFRVGVM